MLLAPASAKQKKKTKPSSPSSIVCMFGVVVDGLFFILFGYIMFTLLLLFLPSVFFFSSCPGAIGRDYLARSQTAVNDWKKKKKKKKHPNSSRVRPACELARPCLHNNLLLLFFRNFASFFWLMTHNSIRLEHT